MSPIIGRSQMIRAPGGGEGPWYASVSGYTSFSVVAGESWIVWAFADYDPPYMGGDATAHYRDGALRYGFGLWILDVTGSGTLTLSLQGCSTTDFLVHRPVGGV